MRDTKDECVYLQLHTPFCCRVLATAAQDKRNGVFIKYVVGASTSGCDCSLPRQYQFLSAWWKKVRKVKGL